MGKVNVYLSLILKLLKRLGKKSSSQEEREVVHLIVYDGECVVIPVQRNTNELLLTGLTHWINLQMDIY